MPRGASTLAPRVCRNEDCGREFLGGPRAWYCPECRLERRRRQSREGKRRKRAGEVRELGSEDVCEICGGPYIVQSGNQRYCPECAPCAIAEVDAVQGLAWYDAHKAQTNPTRNAARRIAGKACPDCGQPIPNTRRVCDACRARRKKEAQRRADAKRRPRREI